MKLYSPNVNHLVSLQNLASQVTLEVKNLPANAGDIRDTGLIPGSGRSSGEGNDNPPEHSCLENAWTGEAGGLQSMGSQTDMTKAT